MNRNKRSLTNRLAKKIQKEVRHAQGRYAAPKGHTYADELTEKELSKMYPRKTPPKAQPKLLITAIKAKKRPVKQSKRTATGLVPSDSTPASVHREGKVWTKTLVKQNLDRRKKLTKKLSKKK